MSFIFGPDNPAIDAIRRMREEEGLERITVLVAWARVAGVAFLLEALGDDIGKVRVAVGMAGAGTSAEALSYLITHCAEVHLFHKHHRQTFHPKVYCFDGPGVPPATSRLMVGSSNLTGGGLRSNFEASLVSNLQPDASDVDLQTWQQVMAAFHDITTSPYCERILDDARIQMLLDDRYLSTEARLKRQSGQDGKGAAKNGLRRNRPEAPPPPLNTPQLPPIPHVFVEPVPLVAAAAPVALPPPNAAQEAYVPDGRFFVRTLTANDVAKILGGQTGTFEPDLGLTARDMLPGFWGYPDRFVFTTRFEWDASARVFSTTRPHGLNLSLLQWVRPPRQGHLAEHRLRIGPRNVFADALPPGFAVNSLLVIQRMEDEAAFTFRLQVILVGEPSYQDYHCYLVYNRAKHRFGFGPDNPD